MVVLDRLDHQAAMAAAIDLRKALRRYRLRLMASSVLAPADERAETERAINDLRRRESALRAFLADPYAKDSLFGMRPDDRAILTEASSKK